MHSYRKTLKKAGHPVTSHYVLTLMNNISALKPSVCHLADGWGLTRQGK